MSDVTQAADRIAAFLNDDAVVAGLHAMKEYNYRQFLAAKSDEDRHAAQAQAVVLDGFTAMLQGLVDAGERERTERAMAERPPAAR